MRVRRAARAWAGGRAAALVVTLLGCERVGEPGASPPVPEASEPAAGPVILITLGSTRADHLGYHGYPHPTSPVLDDLATESIQYDLCLAPMASSLPALVSLFTATEPLEHGVLHQNAQAPLARASARTFAAWWRAEGRRTAAFVSSPALSAGSGIEAGFETYVVANGAPWTAEETTQRARAWWRAREGEAYFLWIHLSDPAQAPRGATANVGPFPVDAGLRHFLRDRHYPAEVIDPATGKAIAPLDLQGAYDAAVRAADAAIGTLLAELRAHASWHRTSLVVTADHGVGLGQHLEASAGGTWHEQLHIPLLMRIPGRPPERRASLMGSAQILPALLRLRNDPPPAGFTELFRIDRSNDEPNAFVLLGLDAGERMTRAEYRYALTSARWKYFFQPGAPEGRRDALFDRTRDPYELQDVAGAQPAECDRLRGTLDRILQEQRRRAPELAARPAGSSPGPEIQERR